MKPLEMGEVIKLLREQKGWTQTQLAQKLEYNNRTTIAKIEAGSNGLSKEKLEQLADTFGVSVDYIFNTLERNLYALDYEMSDLGDKVALSNSMDPEPNRRCVFLKEDWEEFKMAGKIKPVIDIFESGVTEYKKSPDTLLDIEGLSEAKRSFIKRILSLSDDEVEGLDAIVDRVLALRGK